VVFGAGWYFIGYLWQRSLGLRRTRSWIPAVILAVILSTIMTGFVRMRIPAETGNTLSSVISVLVVAALPSIFAVGLLEWVAPESFPKEMALQRQAALAFGWLFAIVAAPLPILWLIAHVWGLAAGIAAITGIAVAIRVRSRREPRLRTILIWYGGQWLLWNLGRSLAGVVH